MISNMKVDATLQLAQGLSERELEASNEMSAGYMPEEGRWRLIVRYNGDITAAAAKYSGLVVLLSDSYAIVTIAPQAISDFSDEPSVEYIEKPKLLHASLVKNITESCIYQVQSFPQYRLLGDGMLIGIVDSGIDYTHPDFIDDDGNSRIAYLWDQDDDSGFTPDGFITGSEYDAAMINAALKATTADERYRIVPEQDYVGHGTHVAGICAGNGRASNGLNIGVAPKSRLIIVKLRRGDNEGYGASTIGIMLGIRYIINKAEELNMPVAINISHGANIGPHDGTSQFETYVRDMAARWKTSIVVASGNNGISGIHYKGNVQSTRSVPFVVPSKNSSVTVDIWKNIVDDFSIEIINPRGVSTGIIPYQDNKFRYSLGSEKLFVVFQKSSPFSTKENIVIEIINDLDIHNEGIWKIVFHPNSIIDGTFQIWLSSSLNNVNFQNPSIEHTLTIPSTVDNVITVGGYDALDGHLANYSGRGFIFSGFYQKPDLVAPSENITSCAPGGGYNVMSGTSMATPFVTGAAALLMEWGILRKNDEYLYGLKLRSYLCAGARRDPALTYPSIDWGYGRLCLLNTMLILTGNPPVQSTAYPSRQIAAELTASLIASTDSPAQAPTSKTPDEPSRAAGTAPSSVAEVEQKIRSDDYIDLVVEDNQDLEEALLTYPELIRGAPLPDRLVILHTPKYLIEPLMRKIHISTNLSYPLLFTTCDYDTIVDTNILPLHNNPNMALRGKGVLIGLLDTGIDYRHPAFVYEDNTTKIAAIWDQTQLTGHPPMHFKYGTEYNREEINGALQSTDPLSFVPVTDEDGHGTFTAGVACGREPGAYIGAAPEAEILFVKLAQAKKFMLENSMVFKDNAVAFQDTDVLCAIEYLMLKSEELNRPLVICLGIGTTQGSHDGRTYYPINTHARGLAFVTAAGNEGNARNHTMRELSTTGGSATAELNIAKGEEGIAIYFWNSSPDIFSISLVSPAGERIDKVPIRNSANTEYQLVFYPSTIWVTYYHSVDRNSDQLIVVRIKNPEPGIWSFILHGDYIINGKFHAWLLPAKWLETNTFFIDSDTSTTIVDLGNSPNMITVGAYNHIDQNLYIESSLGPTRDGRIKPDLLAPGVRVGGPLPGGGYGRMSGTSIAAALTAGAAALLMEWGLVQGHFSDLNTQVIRSLLILGARRNPGISYPNNQYGYGQLDLMSTFRTLGTNPYGENSNFFIFDSKLLEAPLPVFPDAPPELPPEEYSPETPENIPINEVQPMPNAEITPPEMSPIAPEDIFAPPEVSEEQEVPETPKAPEAPTQTEAQRHQHSTQIPARPPFGFW